MRLCVRIDVLGPNSAQPFGWRFRILSRNRCWSIAASCVQGEHVAPYPPPSGCDGSSSPQSGTQSKVWRYRKLPGSLAGTEQMLEIIGSGPLGEEKQRAAE